MPQFQISIVLVFLLVQGCSLPERFREPCPEPPEAAEIVTPIEGYEGECATFHGFTACVDDESAARGALAAGTYARILDVTAGVWEQAGYVVRDCLAAEVVAFHVFESEDTLEDWCDIHVGRAHNLYACSIVDYSTIGFAPGIADYTPITIHEIGHLAAWCATGDADGDHSLPVWWSAGPDAPTYQAYATEAASCGATPAKWVEFKHHTL